MQTGNLLRQDAPTSPTLQAHVWNAHFQCWFAKERSWTHDIWSRRIEVAMCVDVSIFFNPKIRIALSYPLFVGPRGHRMEQMAAHQQLCLCLRLIFGCFRLFQPSAHWPISVGNLQETLIWHASENEGPQPLDWENDDKPMDGMMYPICRHTRIFLALRKWKLVWGTKTISRTKIFWSDNLAKKINIPYPINHTEWVALRPLQHDFL